MLKLGLILAAALLPAATVVGADSTFTDTLPVGPDSALAEDPTAQLDTILYVPGLQLTPYTSVSDTTNLERHLRQNPTVALFKSMIIPGWGQWGNRSRFKAVLFLALDAWMITSAVDHGRKASDLHDQFRSLPVDSISRRNAVYSDLQDERDQRNKFTWFAVIVSFVAMFDAYVDAHLSGFPDKDQGDRISLDMEPALEGGLRAAVRISF